jgi:hypothetical protein
MSYFSPIPPDDAPRLEAGGDDQLVLVKNGRRYAFDCPPGREPELIEHFRQLVDDPASEINWFDAAVLTHQLGERMSDRLSQLVRNRRPA